MNRFVLLFVLCLYGIGYAAVVSPAISNRFSGTITADGLTITSQNYMLITGTGGTARLQMEPLFSSLDLLDIQYFNVSSDSGHLSMGVNIDSGVRRLGVSYIGVTNGQNGVGNLSAGKVDLSSTITLNVTTPTATGQLAFDSGFVLYVGTQTSTANWTKIGAQ